MLELLITSSLLILAVLAARALLNGRISRRMQYALWALVLLRLLLPVSLPQSRASVLNALPDTAQVRLARPEEIPAETLPVPVDTETQTAPAPETDLAQPAADGTQAGLSGGVSDITDGTSGSARHPEWSFNPAALLPVFWAAGALLTGGALLWANLRFALRLRRERCQLDLEPERTGGLPVYLCHNLASPCLHGLFRPAIYLNPAAMESRERLDFVLAHEKTHHRHKDHIWGALRCLVLATYWFDPLVWWAAAASKRDCELACDEAVTAAMEEARRRDYGRCLVELIPRRAPGTALLAATSMSSTAGAMQRRLKAIVTAKKPRRAAIALTLAGAVLLTACTFTGAMGKTIASADDLIGEGETVRRRLSWQQESGTQELILVQTSAAPEGQTLTEGTGWFKLYYWNSTRDNTAENTLYYEGRLSNRYPMQVIALNPDGSTSEYTQTTADDTVQLLNVYLYQPDASFNRYDWQDGMLSNVALKSSATGSNSSGGDYTMQDDVLEQLMISLRPVEGGIQFTIPEAEGWTGADWQLGLYQMDGKAITRGLPEAFTTQSWQPGQGYLVPYSCLDDGPVTLIAWMAAEPGGDVQTENWSIAIYDPFAVATGIYEGGWAQQTMQTRSEAERIAMFPEDFRREETARQQALEQLWASCIWQDEILTFTIPEGLSPETEELRLYWTDSGTGMLTSIAADDYGISLALNRSGGNSLLSSDEQGLLTGQTWQPGDTITVNGTGRDEKSQPVLAVRDKATREEQKIWLPASAQPLPAATPEPTDPDGGAPQTNYLIRDVDPAQSLEFTRRLQALVEGIQYEEGGPLTVTIPESAEAGEWELRLMRYNESRDSWTTVSAGLPDAFVSQGWQPGQQVTVDAETMDGASWKMEAKNTVLGGWAQFQLPPVVNADATPAPTSTPTSVDTDPQALAKMAEEQLAKQNQLDQQAQERADEAERQYDAWVASQSALGPTPTPIAADGVSYPEGRVRSRGTLELDGRTQELVALQIQPPRA